MKYDGPHANLLKPIPELVQRYIFFIKSPLFDTSLIPFLQKPIEQLPEMLFPIARASDATKQQVWICIAVQNPQASAKDLIKIAKEIQLSPKDIMECAIAIGKLAIVEMLDPALLNENHFVDAAFYGHLEIVEFFAKKYKLIDLVKASNYRALRKAVEHEHFAIVKYFVKNATPDILPKMTDEIIDTGITSHCISMVAWCIKENFAPLYWLTKIKEHNYALVRKSVIWDPSITYYFLDFLTKHDSKSVPTTLALFFSICARDGASYQSKAIIELMEFLAKKMSPSLLKNTIKEEFNFFQKRDDVSPEDIIIYLAEQAFTINSAFFKELLAEDNYGIISKVARDNDVAALKYFYGKDPTVFPKKISANRYIVMYVASSQAFLFLASQVPSKDFATLIKIVFLKAVKDGKTAIVEWCVTTAGQSDSARSVLKEQLPKALPQLYRSTRHVHQTILHYLTNESPNFVREFLESLLAGELYLQYRHAKLTSDKQPLILKQEINPEKKEPEKEKTLADNTQNQAGANYSLGMGLFDAASPESQRKTASSGLHF